MMLTQVPDASIFGPEMHLSGPMIEDSVAANDLDRLCLCREFPVLRVCWARDAIASCFSLDTNS